MSTPELARLHARVLRLRSHLSDTCSHVESIALRTHVHDEPTRYRLRVTVVAIRVVVDELEELGSALRVAD